MVTFAQAQERAEEWINGDVPSYQHREVRVREFELGFVVWAEDRADGPRSDGGAQRLVIARDSGEATLWPALPVGEVVRRYEEEYGRPEEPADAVPAASARVDLNQTSFLLSPPEWLQEAADKLGIQDRRGADASGGSGESAGAVSGAASASGGGALPETQAGAPVAATPAPGASVGSGGGAQWPPAGGSAGVPDGATPWAGTDTNADGGEDRSVPLPATVFAPPLRDSNDATPPDAQTALMSGGSQLPPTAEERALDGSARPGAQGAVGGRGATPPSAPPGGSSYGYPQGGANGPGAPGTPPPAQSGSSYGFPQSASNSPGTQASSQSGPGASSYGYPLGAPGAPQSPGGSGAPRTPSAPGASPAGSGGSSYGYPQGGPGASQSPAGPGAPGTPPSAPGASSYGYPQGAPGSSQPPAGAGAPGSQGGASSGYPQGAPGAPQPPAGPGVPAAPVAPPDAGDIADAATSKAGPPPRRARGAGGNPPPPPSAPGTPGARPASTPPAPASGPGAPAGGYVPTQMVSSLGSEGPGASQGGPGAPNPPGAPQAPGAPHPPGAPNPPGGTPPGGVHQAATMFADPGRTGPGGAGSSGGAPQPPGAPGVPNSPGAQGGPGAPGIPGGPGAPGAPQAPGAPGAPGGAGAPGAPAFPGAPQPPGAPGAPGGPGPQGSAGGARGAVHHAETVLSAPPVGGPGAPPPPPPAPGAPGMVPGAAQPAMPPAGQAPGQPPAYGYPQPQGQPTVGPGYQAVLRYRAQDGSEQQVIRRSAPGTPHPEWQIFHELRGMNVPPDQVLELHTELESCELPGAYCARMIREQWPQARIASIAPYGTDHASRQQGMHQLLAHQGELHQVADGPARPAPVRAPLPPVQSAPPIPPEAIAQELAAAFGPGVFRFEQAAVSRQGVPPVVAHSLVAAGLPVDLGPFFWAQAQPGRPVPTLAELAQERGVRPAPDAGSYLVMGSDFGKAICVQYGTANIVAVPVEAGPGGASVPPQFVNTGLPEFQRCLGLLGRMWRLRYGLNQEQAGRWTVDFQAQLASLDPASLGSPESWWSVLLEQMWDGLL
ncbi:SUKH-4 family immunity protein [Streptomyces sp. NPDC092369]|uniref:SUKH-4 family immunity protein n=1 Tax=Streptomyces sp. NPDC092369 TaxID=3366015 RepID=UPI00382C2EDB